MGSIKPFIVKSYFTKSYMKKAEWMRKIACDNLSQKIIINLSPVF